MGPGVAGHLRRGALPDGRGLLAHLLRVALSKVGCVSEYAVRTVEPRFVVHHTLINVVKILFSAHQLYSAGILDHEIHRCSQHSYVTHNVNPPCQPDKFRGKVVWVTGASTGIGAALAVEAASHGAKVAITARSEDKLREVKARCLSKVAKDKGDGGDLDGL